MLGYYATTITIITIDQLFNFIKERLTFTFGNNLENKILIDHKNHIGFWDVYKYKGLRKALTKVNG